jgi:hypothetical protein
MGYPDFCIQMDTKTRIDLKDVYLVIYQSGFSRFFQDAIFCFISD